MAEINQPMIDALLSLIGDDRSGSLLILSDDKLPEAMVQSFEKMDYMSTAEAVDNLDSLGNRRWPLVCLLNSEITTTALTTLLARLRNLHAARIVHIDRCKEWTFADSLALGFSKVPADRLSSTADERDTAGFTVFEFEIHNYKHTPDWLNSKNWANPGLWGKHSW